MKLFKFFMSRILTVHFDRSSKKNFAKDTTAATSNSIFLFFLMGGGGLEV